VHASLGCAAISPKILSEISFAFTRAGLDAEAREHSRGPHSSTLMRLGVSGEK
jgi:hypothetical protein